MKSLFAILLIFTSCLLIRAQELELSDVSSDIVAMTGADTEVPLNFTNKTDQTINVNVRILEKDLGTGQSIKLCLGDECYEDVDKLPHILQVYPNQSIEQLFAVFQSGQSERFSSAVIRIENVDDPGSYVDRSLNFRVDAKMKEALYATGEMIIGTVYPNPVREVAMIDYKLKDDTQDVKIVLHNVLGSTVEEFELNPFENQLKFYTSEYNPGVYFYTLYIDSDGITTKKMIVRH